MTRPKEQRLFQDMRRQASQTLKRHLDPLALPAAIERLKDWHTYTRFVAPEDFQPEKSYELTDDSTSRYLRAEYRPKRANRPRKFAQGARYGAATHNGCPLAPENMPGNQCPYERAVEAGGRYNILTQISPFGEDHSVFASPTFATHDWRPGGSLVLRKRLADMYAIARQLPGFLVFWNGWQAGASIDWFHLQALRNATPTPLQRAADAAQASPFEAVTRIDEPFWPIPAIRFRGPGEFIVDEAVKSALGWNAAAGEHATENILMFSQPDGVSCYYVPRDRRRERADGLAGAIGSYEAAGVFIFSVDAEKLDAGELGFREVWQFLGQARPEARMV